MLDKLVLDTRDPSSKIIAGGFHVRHGSDECWRRKG